jgi:hypothetical protein
MYVFHPHYQPQLHKDLTIIQYAAVMGLNTDLSLMGNDFSNASTAFFIAYLVAEVPNSRFLFLYEISIEFN